MYREGWDQGIMEMSLGEKCILTISRYIPPGSKSFPDGCLLPQLTNLCGAVIMLMVNGKLCHHQHLPSTSKRTHA